MFHFPLDSVSEAKVKHEPKTGKVVGAIMGGAIDVTVIVLLANADWGGYGNFFD